MGGDAIDHFGEAAAAAAPYVLPGSEDKHGNAGDDNRGEVQMHRPFILRSS